MLEDATEAEQRKARQLRAFGSWQKSHLENSPREYAACTVSTDGRLLNSCVAVTAGEARLKLQAANLLDG
jgi:hypothetical protein